LVSTPHCRYNLKRKIAGLPPVTHEWYEARRAQLTAASAGALQRVWFDPLTKKKFYSQNTYSAFTRSKKYQELVKNSGKSAPAAIVTIRRIGEAGADAAPVRPSPVPSAPAGFTVKPAVHNAARDAALKSSEDKDQEEDVDSGSEWETASEEEMEMGTGSGEWEDWDVCRSLFDNHQSPTMEANLEYMWRKFGFYLPDSEYLVDPEGLLRYLGAKIQFGNIPLYESGNNPNAKQMASLHGTQRHMIDVGRCKVLYDDNEDEYAEFYDYAQEAEGIEHDRGTTSAGPSSTAALILGNDDEAAAGGFELSVAAPGGGVRMLGAREFFRYYKQRHRAGDQRASMVAARVVSRYRQLSVPLLGDGTDTGAERAATRRADRAVQRVERQRIAVSMRRNVNDNLPKNVPY